MRSIWLFVVVLFLLPLSTVGHAQLSFPFEDDFTTPGVWDTWDVPELKTGYTDNGNYVVDVLIRTYAFLVPLQTSRTDRMPTFYAQLNGMIPQTNSQGIFFTSGRFNNYFVVDADGEWEYRRRDLVEERWVDEVQKDGNFLVNDPITSVGAHVENDTLHLYINEIVVDSFSLGLQGATFHVGIGLRVEIAPAHFSFDRFFLDRTIPGALPQMPQIESTIIFADDFHDPASGWRDDFGWDYTVDGEYRMFVRQAGTFGAATAPEPSLARLERYCVSVDVKLLQGSSLASEGFAGLFINGVNAQAQATDTALIVIGIASDGGVGAIAADFDASPQLLGQQGDVFSNVAQFNNIKVRVADGQAVVFVNDTETIALSRSAFVGELGVVGLSLGEPNLNARFDNFTVSDTC